LAIPHFVIDAPGAEVNSILPNYVLHMDEEEIILPPISRTRFTDIKIIPIKIIRKVLEARERKPTERASKTGYQW